MSTMSSTTSSVMMDPSSSDTDEVKKYSVLVGFLLVLVFVVPCITLALMAKCFQKQSRRTRRASTIVSTAGSIKYMGDDRQDTTMGGGGVDSDSSGFGTFGLIVFPGKKLDCIEKMVTLKHQLSCIEVWKTNAPSILIGGSEDCKKLIAVLKPATTTANGSGRDGSKETHTACLKAELTYLSRVPSHHAILNLLGVCSPSSQSSASPTALLLEYPLYGSMLSFLVCKRLGHISNRDSEWAALDYQKEEETVLRALPEENRPFLSRLLDDYRVRQRPFSAPLNVNFTDVDLLLFALQIVNGLQHLSESGIMFKQLSSDNIVISAGFFLKLSCLSPDTAFPMHRRQASSSRRATSSGRNMMKWDAPEVIEGTDNTEKSDIWRYGMVLWEISSLGDTPFAEIPGKSLVEMIRKGELPHQPENCSSDFYTVMKRCWKLDSSSRPTLDDLTRITLAQLQPHETMDTPDFDAPHSPSPHSSMSYQSAGDQSESSQAVLIPDSPAADSYEETDV